MYRGHTIGVVVPAYNEADHIGDVFATMPGFVDRIYAVDDRSTDDTWAVIQAHAVDSPQEAAAPRDEVARPSVTDGGAIAGPEIVPVRHMKNLGAGAALRTGYICARDDGVDVVATMDADGQMDPDQLSALLDPIVEGEADYAKGNRLADPADRRAMPAFRLFGNGVLTLLTKMASGYWGVQDPQNGYTAISHEALSAIDVESLPDDHDYTNDLLVRLNVADARVADVSMPAVYDDEESTIRYRTFVPATSLTLLRGFVRRVWTQASDDERRAAACYAAAIAAIVAAIPVAMIAGAAGIAFAFAGAACVLALAVRFDVDENARLEVYR